MSKAEEVMVKRTRIKCLKVKNGLALEMMTRMTMDQRTGRLMTRRLMIPLKKALSMCLIVRFCMTRMNIIGEEDIGGGLKEIMTYHMSKLREKLDMFATLASTEVKDEDEEEDEEKTRGEMNETS